MVTFYAHPGVAPPLVVCDRVSNRLCIISFCFLSCILFYVACAFVIMFNKVLTYLLTYLVGCNSHLWMSAWIPPVINLWHVPIYTHAKHFAHICRLFAVLFDLSVSAAHIGGKTFASDSDTVVCTHCSEFNGCRCSNRSQTFACENGSSSGCWDRTKTNDRQQTI